MLRKLLFTAIACLLAIGSAFAQTASISGTVIDASSGETLPGVNVFLPELQRGSPTNAQGEFEISNIEYGTYTIRVSFIGYETNEQQVEIDQANTKLEIQLASKQMQLDDVVVTAFGLAREERSVSYSVQEVSGENLTMASEENLVGSLSGKISGVQVIGSPGASLGGSEKIRIRGESGLSASNPLFVVDGTPISNRSFNINNRDFGNLAQDLNIGDVESISVLKGASASALYGNRAADGVIVIETKSGQAGQSADIEFTNSTVISKVYKLPDYQNKYAGGYSGELVNYTDPETGNSVPGLEYEADESWGPPMEGQKYRPWYSWYHGDFTGDGKDDYGTTTTLDPNPDNVRNFYDTGVKVSNSLAISGGSKNGTYRVSVKDLNKTGVMPNSKLDKTFLNFKGSLKHGNSFESRVSFNYIKTESRGRASQSYSPLTGNVNQMFNQWFQRQLGMDELKNYRLEDGSIATWNIIDPTAENLTPQYWNSPYFTTHENVPFEDRNRVYGNYTLNYNITKNLQATARVHADVYGFNVEDRIASGGLNTDWYSVQQRSRREMNYEGSLQYSKDFADFSVEGFVGANLRQQKYKFVRQSTQGGLTVPGLYNIDASADRPSTANETQEKEVRSVYGTVNIGWKDMLYADITLRNDWSSALPEDNNSYLYYGFSGSFVFTELSLFDNIDWLTYGKIRASMAQVGNDLDPYQVSGNYNVQPPRGSYPAMRVPQTRSNPNLEAAISTDYELGTDLRFLEGRLRLDGTWYQSVSENEILNLQLSATSGYDQLLVNAGEFVKNGVEVQFGGTPIEKENFTLNTTFNWGKLLKNEVVELAPQINSRLLDNARFISQLYAREGETWGKIVSNGYKRHKNGEPIFNPKTGGYKTATNVDHGTILPDWNGGFRADFKYKNWSLGAFIEFQKGGQFYSMSKMFNNYAGLGAATAGTNTLGNPLRNQLRDKNGNVPVDGNGDPLSAIPLDQAGDDSGGILVEGVDENGDPVQYMAYTRDFYYTEFINQEAYLYDASYIKLKSVSLGYSLSGSTLESLPIESVNISVHAQNPLIIWASVNDVDASIIQESGNDFGGWWEGGSLPGARSIGFTVNVGL
ncbi:SusC/RagA family TonB-linked outer membrane protein [Fodinibius saliphilus]|uniref:SusC/RagA family TonB-linked outer membrane protein n=1 Tax=Fodinibius saliphilus TaxID=1920650 RepID=UPI001486B311|nr:SusC/RagA family TonB-linked outer membrane protein [Fodinibius saliphilus]